jgi:ABC-type transport system involved in cytochrome bd biosynthesis fused ATPase/permease subunit
VAGTALLQVGAIGLGAAVAALATTTFADVTGILAAGTLSVIGLLLLPARRREAREKLRKSVTEMRGQLIQTLTESFERELGRREQRLAEAIAPYTRFVRAEGDRLKGQREALVDIGSGLVSLRARIEAL